MDPVLSSLLRINRQRMRALRRSLAPYQYVGVMHLIVLYTGRSPGARQEDIACFYALDKTSVARAYAAFAAKISGGISPEDWQHLQELLKRLEDNSCAEGTVPK